MTTAEAVHTTAAPERSLTQRLDALRRANEIRTYRAQLKRNIKAGRVRGRSLTRLVLDPPEQLLTMKVWDLLLALPKVGRVKANRALVLCRCSPSKTVGGLSERQRGEILRELGRP